MQPGSPVTTDTPERIYVPLDAAIITPSDTNPLAAVKASYTDKYGITYTATQAGASGNDIDFVFGGGANNGATVDGNEITVTYALALGASDEHDFGAVTVEIARGASPAYAGGQIVELITPITVSSLPLSVVEESEFGIKVYLETDGSSSASASLTTALTGADNDLVFTSKLEGTLGNILSVSYVAPTEAGLETKATQDNGAISVILAGSIVDSSLTTALTGSNNDLVFTSKIAGSVGNTISVEYRIPEEDTEELEIEVNGSEIVAILEATYDAASLTTSLAGSDNDLVFTAKTPGAGGNDIQIAYIDPLANDQDLSVSVAGPIIEVYLATDNVGAVTTTAAQIITAIEGDAGADALVSVANAGGDNGTGIVTGLAAANLTGGGVTVATTSAEIKDAIEADDLADALVSVANAAGNTGAGAVTEMAKTNLSGAGLSITSTAAEVKAAIEASSECNNLVSVANAGGNDGTGIVTAMAETSLSGGLYAPAVSTAQEVVDAINNASLSVSASIVDGTTSTVLAPHKFVLQTGQSGATARDIVAAINSTPEAAALVTAVIDPKTESVPTPDPEGFSLAGGLDGQWSLTQTFARGFEVGVAGDVSFETFNGTVVTRSYEAGDREEIAIKGILADGTTANEILGLA